MQVETKIQKWGNELALRISGIIREVPGFYEGCSVVVDVNENGFTVTKQKLPAKKCFPFSEKQLLKDLTPETGHTDLIATPLSSELER